MQYKSCGAGICGVAQTKAAKQSIEEIDMSEYYQVIDAAITVVSVVFVVSFATAVVVWTWIIIMKIRDL